jgi:hypothetical protein
MDDKELDNLEKLTVGYAHVCISSEKLLKLIENSRFALKYASKSIGTFKKHKENKGE